MKSKRVLAGLAIATLLSGLPLVALGQETSLHKKVTVAYYDQELAEALKDLGERAGVRFVCGDELLKGADKVTYATTRQEVGRIAGRILRPRGLKLAKLDGGAAGQVSVEKLDAVDAIKSKRVERFEFAEKPTASRDGDTMTIRFAVKDLCDATVAIEDGAGNIVRHLASGVLGENAPAPFSWNTKNQEIVWDCKDDKGQYVRDTGNLLVRVSLGLKPQFERTLYWTPYKLGFGSELLSFCTAPEGVYVFSFGAGRASATPWLKLFDHDGRYVRTLYPFPADELDRVQGLTWQTYPPDGRKFPLKGPPLSQTTLMSFGDDKVATPFIPRALTADKDYVYVVGPRVDRIAKPGSGKPSVVQRPDLMITADLKGRALHAYYPGSVAISPDGKWLYLTSYVDIYGPTSYGYVYRNYLPCVMRMPSDCSTQPERLIGVPELVYGSYPPQIPNGCPLTSPSDVACDRDGRIYVADIIRGLLIFSPEGKLLHEVKMDWLNRVQVSPDTGDIWAMGWSVSTGLTAKRIKPWEVMKPGECNATLHRLTPFKADKPPEVAETLTVPATARANQINSHSSMVDVLAESKRVWFCHGVNTWGTGPLWQVMNARLFEIRDHKLVEIASFDKLAKHDVVQSRPPRYARQRPYVNPADGCVYIAEQIQPTVVSDVQCFDQLVKIAPNTGKCSMVDLPFDTEDMAFDPDGLAYLRTESILARYDSKLWREVPFDYGMELDQVTHYGLKPTKAISAPYFKGGRGASGKIFGMGVNPRGDVAVSFYSTSVSSVEMASENSEARKPEGDVAVKGVKPWMPRVFPGRSTYAFIHIWDKHGRLKFEDAIPGLGEMSDLKIDSDCNLYMISNMVLPDYLKVHPDKFINTLVKMPAGRSRIVTDGSAAPIRLTESGKPNRPPDAIGLSGYRGNVWLEGAEWALGGMGANARDLSARACHCEANSGIALDYFGRSFVPAIHRYEVVVVDMAGNVILRIGRYGNVEDGVPLVKEGGPANPRAMGGDEVSLVSPKWLAVHSDKRLFVSDRGNYRIMSVKLGYYAEEKVAIRPLKEK